MPTSSCDPDGPSSLPDEVPLELTFDPCHREYVAMCARRTKDLVRALKTGSHDYGKMEFADDVQWLITSIDWFARPVANDLGGLVAQSWALPSMSWTRFS